MMWLLKWHLTLIKCRFIFKQGRNTFNISLIDIVGKICLRCRIKRVGKVGDV